MLLLISPSWQLSPPSPTSVEAKHQRWFSSRERDISSAPDQMKLRFPCVGSWGGSVNASSYLCISSSHVFSPGRLVTSEVIRGTYALTTSTSRLTSGGSTPTGDEQYVPAYLLTPPSFSLSLDCCFLCCVQGKCCLLPLKRSEANMLIHPWSPKIYPEELKQVVRSKTVAVTLPIGQTEDRQLDLTDGRLQEAQKHNTYVDLK